MVDWVGFEPTTPCVQGATPRIMNSMKNDGEAKPISLIFAMNAS